MDADTYVHSDWSYDDFIKLLPNDKWITYVGRGKGSATWPECGFYGLNLNHPVCHEFLKEFERMYEDADNGIFLLEEWHDSFVFGDILNRMIQTYPNAHDYSAEMYLREAKSGGGGHPLINGVLGRWIDHMKGGRKDSGKNAKTLWLTEQKIIGMKFSLWTDYGALNSKPVFTAFANSLVAGGHNVVYNDNSADVNVIWSVLFNGRMARNKAVWEQEKPTIVLEVGGIKRGTTWKVGLNGINRDAYFGPNNNDDARVLSLGLTLKPWRTSGEFILIAGQHDKSLQWQNMPRMSNWFL